jgi:hypothetical protein
MVHVRDDGVFDAPLNTIWKYVQDNESHQHRTVRGQKVKEEHGNRMILETEILNPDGKTTRWETWNYVVNPPKGFDVEVLDGPMKGSKYTHTYTPLGNKTKVEVTGDFHIQGMDEAATRKTVLGFFSDVFEEDNSALKNYK